MKLQPLTASEIEDAVRSAHERGFVTFVYGLDHADFVSELVYSDIGVLAFTTWILGRAIETVELDEFTGPRAPARAAKRAKLVRAVQHAAIALEKCRLDTAVSTLERAHRGIGGWMQSSELETNLAGELAFLLERLQSSELSCFASDD